MINCPRCRALSVTYDTYFEALRCGMPTCDYFKKSDYDEYVRLRSSERAPQDNTLRRSLSFQQPAEAR